MSSTSRDCKIYIGYEPREAEAFAICRRSFRQRLSIPIQIKGISLYRARQLGLYWREHERKQHQLWDKISGAPMSTEFAITRFLTPILAQTGFALFVDCDMLARQNVARIFDLADPEKAVMCVQHEHNPTETVKMDNQVQTRYSRKNWSSVMLFNCDHPSNQKLTLEMINTLPGRDLHRFCWLEDHEIGALPPQWNYLVGHTVLPEGVEPAIVHFTDGIPSMDGYENVEYAGEYIDQREAWVCQR